jgi:hypothetical protein
MSGLFWSSYKRSAYPLHFQYQSSQTSSTFLQTFHVTQNGDHAKCPHFLHHNPPSGQSIMPEYFRLLMNHSLVARRLMIVAAAWTPEQ